MQILLSRHNSLSHVEQIQSSLLRLREYLVLPFLDVMVHVFAEHSDPRRLFIVLDIRRFDLGDQILSTRVFNHGFF